MKIVEIDKATDFGVADGIAGQQPYLPNVSAVDFPFLKAYDETIEMEDRCFLATLEHNKLTGQPDLILYFHETNRDLKLLVQEMKKTIGTMNEMVFHIAFKGVGGGKGVFKTSLVMGRAFYIDCINEFGKHPILMFTGNEWVILENHLSDLRLAYTFPEGSSPELVLEFCRQFLNRTPSEPRRVDVLDLIRLPSEKFVEIAEGFFKEKERLEAMKTGPFSALKYAAKEGLEAVSGMIPNAEPGPVFPPDPDPQSKTIMDLSVDEVRNEAVSRLKEAGFSKSEITDLYADVKAEDYSHESNYKVKIKTTADRAIKDRTGEGKDTIAPEDFAAALGGKKDSVLFDKTKRDKIKIQVDGTVNVLKDRSTDEIEPEAEIGPREKAFSANLGLTLKPISTDEIPSSIKVWGEYELTDNVWLGDYCGPIVDNRYFIPHSKTTELVHTVNVKELSGVNMFGEISTTIVVKEDFSKSGYVILRRKEEGDGTAYTNGLYILRLP